MKHMGRFLTLLVSLLWLFGIGIGRIEATIQPYVTGLSWLQKQQGRLQTPVPQHQLLQPGYSFISTSQATPFQRLRKLLQSNKTRTAKLDLLPDVPQCMWNDIKEACNPTQLSLLSIDATPVTVFHRAAARAYDRNLICSGYVNATTCNSDTANRCMYWSKSCVGTDAFELVNWLSGDTLNGQATTAAFTCPGTVAATYRICRTAAVAGANGICNQLPGCHWVNMTSDCLPQSWDTKTFKAVQYLKAGFDSFAVSVWGTCAGACYVRQALVCQMNYNNSAECTKKPFCSWEYDPFDKRKVCAHKDSLSKGTDAFSQAAYKIRTACYKATTEEDCEKARVVPKNIGRYRVGHDVQLITQEESSTCLL